LNAELEMMANIEGKQIQEVSTIDPEKTLELKSLNIDH